MKKVIYGEPERITPTVFCPNFTYTETNVTYPVNQIRFQRTAQGCTLVLPMSDKEQIYGLGLQLKVFSLRGKKLTIRPNADATSATGDSHAPVPFFVSTAGYGIYVDTARNAEFYFGAVMLKKESLKIPEATEIATSMDSLYAARHYSDSNISILIPTAQGCDNLYHRRKQYY